MVSIEVKARLIKIASGVFRGPRRLFTDRLFARFFAQRDYNARIMIPSAALNGQRGRTTIVERILVDCSVRQIVETGTFRGATTAWFAKFGLPVHSVESNKRFAHFNALRFADNPLIHLAQMDSARFLDRLAADKSVTSAVTLFYLDAHWGRRLPLGEEITTIGRAFPAAIILIDDFEVPDDPDYGFDDYGPGKRLDLDLIKRTGVRGLAAFFPVMRGAAEDGPRRGCVVLTTNGGIADRLRRVPLLRQYPI
ncbi:hypothetical protein BH10PSE9_BH10PSE9_06150 [soil metagenome]